MAFQGCNFLIAGSFKGGHTSASISALIYDNAGSVANKFSTTVTHLLISDNEFVKRSSPKTRAVLAHNVVEYNIRIPVIDQAWLLESIERGEREPEEEWDLELNSTESDIEQDAIDREMAQTKKENKKRKRANSVARESTPTSAGSQESPAKVIIKGKLIPVDSNCPLASKAHVYQSKDAVYWHASLIKTAEQKTITIQLLKSDTKNLFWVWTRLAKDASAGKDATFGPVGNVQEAVDHFKKKFKEKTKISWTDRMSQRPVKDRYMYIKPEAVDDMDDFEFDDDMFAQIDTVTEEALQRKTASKPSTSPQSSLVIPNITITAAEDDTDDDCMHMKADAEHELVEERPVKTEDFADDIKPTIVKSQLEEEDEELPDSSRPAKKQKMDPASISPEPLEHVTGTASQTVKTEAVPIKAEVEERSFVKAEPRSDD